MSALEDAIAQAFYQRWRDQPDLRGDEDTCRDVALAALFAPENRAALVAALIEEGIAVQPALDVRYRMWQDVRYRMWQTDQGMPVWMVGEVPNDYAPLFLLPIPFPGTRAEWEEHLKVCDGSKSTGCNFYGPPVPPEDQT